MSWDTVSARLKEILESVDGIYNVHPWFRDIPSEVKFEEAFSVDVDGQTLLTGWMITRRRVTTERPTIDAVQVLDVTHQVEIQGILGLSDDEKSELMFQRSIDGLLSKMKGKFLLESESGGTALSGIIVTTEPQVEEIGHGSFGNLFVHFARVLLSVTERI